MTAGVDAGTIAGSRVDDAVRRILTQKFELGLFERPLTDRSLQSTIGSAEHRAIARQAVAQSQVLLKNDATLPLAEQGSFYVAGSNADDLGHQMGGWSISWQGGSGPTTTGTTILQGIRNAAPDATITYSKDATAPLNGSRHRASSSSAKHPTPKASGTSGTTATASNWPPPTGPRSTRSAPR